MYATRFYDASDACRPSADEADKGGGSKGLQRLFLKEKDNQHEEPLLFAQYAVQQLHDILSSHDLSPDIASIVAEWVTGISQVLPCRLLCLLQV